MSESVFLSNLHYFCAQTDGAYKFPNSAEGDLLKRAKIEVEVLQRENAALRKDKERLDFLQRVAEEGGFQCFGIEDSALLDFEFSNRENETSDSVRAAIDAARAKEGQP